MSGRSRLRLRARSGCACDYRPNEPLSADQKYWFDHEKLAVYQEAIAFVAWLGERLEALPRLGDVKDQLDRASISVVLNIAEGNGKYLPKDKCRYFDIARGSALECAAGVDVLVVKRKLLIEEVGPAKQRLQRIVRMLMGLIKRNSKRDYEKLTDKPHGES